MSTTGTIKNDNVVYFDCTPNTGLSRSIGQGTYNKSTKTVTVYAAFFSNSDLTQSSTLATIPEQFRPSAQKEIMCFINVPASNTAICGIAYVGTNGKITQNESAKARGGLLYGCYQL